MWQNDDIRNEEGKKKQVYEWHIERAWFEMKKFNLRRENSMPVHPLENLMKEVQAAKEKAAAAAKKSAEKEKKKDAKEDPPEASGGAGKNRA